MKVVYMANNGKIFETESACKEYENQINEMKKYRDMAFEFIERCKNVDCEDCPYFRGKNRKCAFGVQPVDWDL